MDFVECEFEIKGQDLIFKNFAGAISEPKHKSFTGEELNHKILDAQCRFGVILDSSIADKLKAEGWNVLTSTEGFSYLRVVVSWNNDLFEGAVNESDNSAPHLLSDLDTLDIKTARLHLLGLKWTHGELSGIKAFLKKISYTV